LGANRAAYPHDIVDFRWRIAGWFGLRVCVAAGCARPRAEMQRLNAVPPSTSATAASTRAAGDVNSLQTIFGSSAKIVVDENRAFRISIASMSYTSFLDRLDQALSRYRLSVDSLTITALASPISAPAANAKTNPPAMVSVDVTLIDSATATTGPNKS
jgi:type II secretory pathway component PulM